MKLSKQATRVALTCATAYAARQISVRLATPPTIRANTLSFKEAKREIMRPFRKLAHRGAVRAVPGELPGRPEEVAGPRELHAGLRKGERLPVVALEERLVIEGVDVGGSALHEEEDDPFRPRREVGRRC